MLCLPRIPKRKARFAELLTEYELMLFGLTRDR